MKTVTKIVTSARKAKVGNGAGARRRGANEPAAVEPKLRIRSILVPIDFSPPSIKALKYAAVFAKQFAAKLTLLHVVEPVAMSDFSAAFPLMIENHEMLKICEEKLQALPRREGLDAKLIERMVVRAGAPYNEIASVAKTVGADLIIIATHGNTGLSRLILGSTTERVVRHAPCPVFVVREQEHEIIEPN